MQQPLLPFTDGPRREVQAFKTQLLKWIGNKQRFAHEIISFFPTRIGTYFEPFLGSGAVLATLAPEMAVGSDVFRPLADIWQTLGRNPAQLGQRYAERRERTRQRSKQEGYGQVKACDNAAPNAAHLHDLCRP